MNRDLGAASQRGVAGVGSWSPALLLCAIDSSASLEPISKASSCGVQNDPTILTASLPGSQGAWHLQF